MYVIKMNKSSQKKDQSGQGIHRGSYMSAHVGEGKLCM